MFTVAKNVCKTTVFEKSQLVVNYLIIKKLSSYNLGPDHVLPANSYTATKLHESVKLRYNSLNKLKPTSLHTIFKQRVDKTPNHAALGIFMVIL